MKGGYGLNLCGLGQGEVAASCQQSNEPSGSTYVHFTSYNKEQFLVDKWQHFTFVTQS